MSGTQALESWPCRECGADFKSQESMNFLVVDDVAPVATMLQEALMRLGHTALCALSGAQALELISLIRFDAVLSDLSMPDMSGWTVGEHIMEVCGRLGVPKTPFILMTGSAAEIEGDQRLRECGVDALIEKPVELLKLVRVALETIKGAR